MSKKTIESAALTAAAKAVKVETKAVNKAEAAMKKAAALAAKAGKVETKAAELAAAKAETKAAEKAAAQALKDAAAEAAESIEAAAIVDELRKINEARNLSAGKFTRLFRRVVVHAYAAKRTDIIVEMLNTVKASRFLPTSKTHAVLSDVCGIEVSGKGTPDNPYAAVLPDLSTERYNRMVLTLSNREFTIDTYARKNGGEDGEKSDPYAEMDGIASAALAAALRKAEKELERLQGLSPKGEQAQAANAERIKRVQSAIDFTKVLGNEIPRLVKAMRLA